MVKISAVVCTRNRATMLERAVESLLTQSIPAGDYEVVVVDNGSTDDSKARVMALTQKYPDVPLKYVTETRTGIAFARNKSFEEASGAYVASIDDDAAANKDWLERILKIVGEEKEPPYAIGGKYIPLYEVPKPSWFLDKYEERTWGEERRYLERGEAFAASNLAVHRESFFAVGGYPTNVGMIGDKLMVGEEPLLFERLWDHFDCRGRIVYDPLLHIRHSSPAFKMKLTAMARRKIVAGQFAARMSIARGENRPVAALRALAAIIVKAFVALFHIFKVRNLHRWVFEGLGIVAEPTARFLGLLGIEPKMKRF